MAEWLGKGLQNLVPRFKSGRDLRELLRDKFIIKSIDNLDARVVELVDTQDLKSCEVKLVWVQVPPRAQKQEIRLFVN